MKSTRERINEKYGIFEKLSTIGNSGDIVSSSNSYVYNILYYLLLILTIVFLIYISMYTLRRVYMYILDISVEYVDRFFSNKRGIETLTSALPDGHIPTNGIESALDAKLRKWYLSFIDTGKQNKYTLLWLLLFISLLIVYRFFKKLANKQTKINDEKLNNTLNDIFKKKIGEGAKLERKLIHFSTLVSLLEEKGISIDNNHLLSVLEKRGAKVILSGDDKYIELMS